MIIVDMTTTKVMVACLPAINVINFSLKVLDIKIFASICSSEKVLICTVFGIQIWLVVQLSWEKSL